ncbi:MAG: flagellar biosynthetic protein FliP, partial [bacterium]|nr:flagellar biosynthetic protein FliP [bacterium]
MTKKLFIFAALFIGTILWSTPSLAQSVSLNLGDASTGTASARIFSVLALITILSLAPSIVIMMTSFTRLIVVLSITRSALATNATPPNMVLISLALFMTIFIMAPTLEKSWDEGIKPVIDEKIELTEGLEKAAVPLKEFMVR